MHKYTKVLLLALVVCLLPETGHAAAAGVKTVFPEGMESTVANFVSILITGINIGAWIAFAFLQYLLDPNFIFDIDANGAFLNQLNEIWQLSRNLMNVFFALALIGASIYTVITQNKGLITEHLRNFVLAVILVNLSWFGPRVILDIANITTAAVYGIPSMLQSGTSQACRTQSERKLLPDCREVSDAKTGWKGYDCDCVAIVDMKMLLEDDELKKYTSDAEKAKGWDCPGSNLLCIRRAKLDLTQTAGHSAMLNGLIVNHAHLQSLSLIPKPLKVKGVANSIIFLIREFIILAIHIALLFPLLAMVLAFAIRIPVLWITMAFMPFAFLGKAGGDKLGFIAEYGKKIWDHFLKAAFLPAMVAVPLTVGFILLNSGTAITGSSFSGITLRLIDDVGDLWKLLWLLMSLAVMWS